MTGASAQSGGRESAERWFQRAVLEADVSIAHEVFTSDVVMYSTAGRLFGVPAMQAAALEFRALDELVGQLVISCARNELIARFRVCGRQVRPFCGVPPNGELLEVLGIVSILAEGEKLAELWKTCATRYVDEVEDTASWTQHTIRQPWARRWALTVREALVAELAMGGQCDKEIAAQLELATASVSKYLRRVLHKAGVTSRSALAERAGVFRLG